MSFDSKYFSELKDEGKRRYKDKMKADGDSYAHLSTLHQAELQSF